MRHRKSSHVSQPGMGPEPSRVESSRQRLRQGHGRLVLATQLMLWHSRIIVVDAADAYHVILVGWVVQGAVQGPIIADGGHHNDAVGGDLLHLRQYKKHCVTCVTRRHTASR